MLLILPPYCAQQTGGLSGGIALREIQPPAPIQEDHPWAAEFVRVVPGAYYPDRTYAFDPQIRGVEIAHNTLP